MEFRLFGWFIVLSTWDKKPANNIPCGSGSVCNRFQSLFLLLVAWRPILFIIRPNKQQQDSVKCLDLQYHESSQGPRHTRWRSKRCSRFPMAKSVEKDKQEPDKRQNHFWVWWLKSGDDPYLKILSWSWDDENTNE